MKSKISNILELEDKKKVQQKYKDSHLKDKSIKSIKNPKEIHFEFELSERKENFIEEIKSKTPINKNPLAKSTSQKFIRTSNYSFRPRNGDHTPKSNITLIYEAQEEPQIEKLSINNTPIKNTIKKLHKEKSNSINNFNTITNPLENSANKREQLKIIDSYLNHYFSNNQNKQKYINKENNMSNVNRNCEDITKNISLGIRSSSHTNIKFFNGIKNKPSPKIINKIDISPINFEETETKKKLSELNSDKITDESYYCLNKNQVPNSPNRSIRKLSKNSSNSNIKVNKISDNINKNSNIPELHDKFKYISEEFIQYNKNNNQSLNNLKNNEKKDSNRGSINHNKSQVAKMNKIKIHEIKKYNTQEIIYDLEKQYSNTKIYKDEEFMQRMMFDVFKRQTKEERLNKIIEKSKPKTEEKQLIETFNRLIQDANRRFDDAEKIDVVKKNFYENEDWNKKLERFTQFAKNYKPPDNWDETYRRFIHFKKERDEIIEKKAKEKERIKKEEEDKIIEEIKKTTKRASKSVIQKSVDRLYSMAQLKEIKREEKLMELKKLNEKYLKDLCCLKLETKLKESKETTYRNRNKNKSNNRADNSNINGIGNRNKKITSYQQSQINNKNYITVDKIGGNNFEMYNNIIYDKKETYKRNNSNNINPIKINNKDVVEKLDKNVYAKKETCNKIDTKNLDYYIFEFDNNNEQEQDNELRNHNINSDINAFEKDIMINSIYNINDVNKTVKNFISANETNKSDDKNFHLKIQDFLESENEEEIQLPPQPIKSLSNSFLSHPLMSSNLNSVTSHKNLNKSGIHNEY